MRFRNSPAILAAIIAIGFSPLLSHAAEKPAAAAQPKTVDPAVMAALNKMGAYLRTLKAFQVIASTSTDQVTDDGEAIETSAVTNILAQPPNRLRMEVTADDHHRLYFYNGNVLTVWAELVNYYATVPAPPTLTQLADDLSNKYGISLPLQDLFFWGTERADSSQITSAVDYGPAQVEGVTCEQYGFRQPGLDWQVWIQNGDYPLPRKLVLTTTSNPSRPRYRSVLTWNLAPSYNETAFIFDPPQDAHKIVLAEFKDQSGNKK